MEPPLPPTSASGGRPRDPRSSAGSQFTESRAKGVENHLSQARGVFPLGGGEPLYNLVGQRGEHAVPGSVEPVGRGGSSAPARVRDGRERPSGFSLRRCEQSAWGPAGSRPPPASESLRPLRGMRRQTGPKGLRSWARGGGLGKL